MTRNDEIDRTRRRFDALVGRRSGIVRELSLVRTIDGDARLFHAGARLADAHPHASKGGGEGGGEGALSGLSVGGSGATPEEALTAALCEGVERYAASAYDPQGPAIAREALPGPSLCPASLVRFGPGQRAQPGFPYPSPTDRTPMRWVPGRALPRGGAGEAFGTEAALLDEAGPVSVPAFAVYVPYEPAAGEPLVGPGLSTGLACGASLAGALLRGACEVIERDAAALTWLRGVSPPRVDDDLLRRFAGDCLPPADDVRAYDLTSDVGVPVALVVCRGAGPAGEIVCVGTAADPSGRRALRKAALEASQGRVYVRLLVENAPRWRPEAGFANVNDFAVHARLYSGRPDLATEALAFLEGNRRPVALVTQDDPGGDGGDDAVGAAEAPRAALSRVLEALRHKGLAGAFVDLTPEWAAPLGLRVAKVIVPGLLPLHGHHALAYLGHPRLRDWRAALPAGEVRHGMEWWPFPHPFP